MAEPASATAPAWAAAFTPGLLDPARAAPAIVAGPHGKAAARRYDVYRNNVTVSLINALAATFPAVACLAGSDLFPRMARSHVRATPPASPLLFEYGRDFPDFIAAYPPAAPAPWLADVARIERAWLDAYHAADAPALDAGDLGRVPPAGLAGLRLVAHPAKRIVPSRFPAVTLFAAARNREPVPSPDGGAEDALVTRPDLDVVVRRLPPGGARFLSALAAGATLAEAAASAMEETAGFDLPANIAGMIDAGAFTAIMGG